MENQVQEITKTTTKGALILNKGKGVYAGTYQKEGTMSVEFKQAVTTVAMYPSKRATNDKNGSFFSNAEFGFTATPYTSVENRVGWMQVPVGTTIEQVEAAMAANPGAMLYRELSNRPILTGDQQYTINAGTSSKSLADYANSQAVRYPEAAGEKAGQLILDENGKVQYRRTFFSVSSCADTNDKRTSDKLDAFLSEELKAELAALTGVATVVTEQTVM